MRLISMSYDKLINLMPQVATLEGIEVFLYAAEPPDEAPPHVHAYYGNEKVRLAIKTSAVLGGRLPGKQLRRAKRWVAGNKARLSALWEELNV